MQLSRMKRDPSASCTTSGTVTSLTAPKAAPSQLEREPLTFGMSVAGTDWTETSPEPNPFTTSAKTIISASSSSTNTPLLEQTLTPVSQLWLDMTAVQFLENEWRTITDEEWSSLPAGILQKLQLLAEGIGQSKQDALFTILEYYVTDGADASTWPLLQALQFYVDNEMAI